MPRRSTAIEAPRPGKSHRRALFLAIGLVAWMALIGARLVQLQVSQHDDFTSRARNQQLSAIETSPTRGQVLDRQGKELARSIETGVGAVGSEAADKLVIDRVLVNPKLDDGTFAPPATPLRRGGHVRIPAH